MDVRKVLVAAVWLASLLGVGPVANAVELQGVVHKDVILFAAPPKPGVTYDISIVGADKALTDIRKALDLLYRKSPFSRTAIQTLRKNGKVFIVYEPNFPEKGKDLTTIKAAAFFPDYFEKHGGGPGGQVFLAIVTRYGIKWPTPELAAVLAHELVGHATQQLLGRLGFIRELDIECEAYLYQEKAFQDLGVDKFAKDIVLFRQNLENHFCSDFKRYLRKRDPASAKLWDVLNPDVPRLLAVFDAYAKDLSAKGVSGKAIKAAEKQLSEKRLRRIAEKGSSVEQFSVALAFRDGLDVSKDQGKAVKWFKLAAKNGLKQAQLELGFIYDKGLGVTPSNAEAAKWFRKAADQGLTVAQYHLALRYQKGKGVKKDAAQAAQWYYKAAKRGFAIAQYQMAKKFAKGDGVQKNHAEAVTWFRKAADQGLAVAQYQLARRYQKGKGVKKDAAQAARWYHKAAKQGDARSQNKLGILFRKGQGVPEDDAEGAQWIRKAAVQGLSSAQYYLARILWKGEGVPKNRAEALKWFQKAAEAGVGRAQRSLGSAYEKGHGIRQDLVQAYKWYALATKKGTKGAAKRRDGVAKRMTPAQISQAKALVRQWKPKKS